MTRHHFVCERCGKTIAAYKNSTSSRRKCSGCGSYKLKPTAPQEPASRPLLQPREAFRPKNVPLQEGQFPSVSIIIPTYNGKHHLEKCLPALSALDYPQDRVEIIVVDNASSDGTGEFIREQHPSVKCIRQEENHYCRANNLGIRAAKGEYIALLNNDTEVEGRWLGELVRVIHADPSIGAAGSKVLLLSGRIHTTGHYEQPNFHWGDRGFEEEDKGQYDEIEEVPSLCGVSVLYRRACLDDVGLLDERFVAYYEDVDISLRCREKGWKLVYVPASVVHHFYNGTAANLQQEGMSFTRFYTERNRLLLLAKHQPEKLPDAISTFSHFYVDKDYAVLYQSLPLLMTMLFETVDAGRLAAILSRLFENIRKVALYESEGIRTERIMYQRRLKELEAEWRQNLTKEVEANAATWRLEMEKKQADFSRQFEEMRQAHLAEKEKAHLALEKEKSNALAALSQEMDLKKAADLAAQQAELEKEKSGALEALRTGLEEKHGRELTTLRTGLEEKHGSEMAALRSELEEKHKQEIRDLRAGLEEMHKEEHKHESRNLRAELEEKHKQEIRDLRAGLEGTHKLETRELRTELHERYKREVLDLKNELVGKHREEIQVVRTELEGINTEVRERYEGILARGREKIQRLKEEIARKEQDLGQLSYELAVARQHPLAKLSSRLKLSVYRQDTKEALIAQLGNRFAAKERDLRVALTKLDAEYARFRTFQKDNEEKVAQFLAAEQRATDLNAEVLALRKRLAVHEGEVGTLVGEVAKLRAGAALSPGSVSDELPEKTLSELPAEVHYSITAKCNFRCRHCDIWKQKGRKGRNGSMELSTEEAKALITRLHGALGTRTLHIAGGEPFLRKDLFEVLGHAGSLGFSTLITTNGFRIDERVAEQIAVLKPKAVNVSIDGMEEVHDAIRGVPGSYRRAVRALELLNAAKKGTNVILTTVMNSLNLGQLEGLVRLAESMNLDGIAFQALTNEFSSAYRPDWWQRTDLWPTDATAIDKAISGLVRLKLAGSPITNSVAHLEHMRHYFTHPGAYPGECRVGSRTLHLNERGECLLCWNMLPLGNALTDDLLAVWRGEKAQRQREEIRRCSRECFLLNCNYL